ncbi:uncharacterized protein METZ01_LOCUS302719, partial [marine metagenome]
DTGDSNTCALAGADSGSFSCTVDSAGYILAFSSAPDYDSAGDADADNDYVVTVTISDGVNTGSTISYTVTVDDTNDQTPTYSASDATPSVIEGTTATDAFSITDSDTGDVNACTLAGADSALFTCTVSGDSVSLAFTTAPDYESPGDADTDNIHAVTLTISDGVNTGSTISYTVTVTDSTSVLIQTGQTGSVAEDASVGDSVMTLTITDGTPTAIIISAGNGDGVFAISTAGVISIADVTNLNYEATSSYTLTVVAYDASSSDVADVTVSITDANDAPTGSVTISGTAAEDQVLTASNDLADEDVLGAITYTWSNGDTGSTTTLGQSDVGSAITVTAAYTDGQGTAESSTSAATAAVANVNDSPTGSVTISGTAAEDQVLT